MRVQFDHQIFRLQETGGISRYFVELARTYIENPEIGIEPVFNFRYTCNRHLFEAFPKMGFKLVEGALGKFLLKLLAFLPNKVAPGVECLHYTFYLPSWKIIRPATPTITTLHDMIPELAGTKPGIKNPHFAKVRYLEESTAVISVSKSSALDFKNIVKPSRRDLYVVPHGTALKNLAFKAKRDSDVGLLFVGNRSGYKDGMLAIRALGLLNDPDLKLIFAGGGTFNQEENKLIANLGLQSQIKHVAPTDKELVELYVNAKALISPSKFEGFGLPILEASLFECPLVISKIPPYEELLGPLAFYFDAGSVEQLAQQILNVLQNPRKARDLASKCQTIAESYTWHKCARLTAQVYKGLAVQE